MKRNGVKKRIDDYFNNVIQKDLQLCWPTNFRFFNRHKPRSLLCCLELWEEKGGRCFQCRESARRPGSTHYCTHHIRISIKKEIILKWLNNPVKHRYSQWLFYYAICFFISHGCRSGPFSAGSDKSEFWKPDPDPSGTNHESIKKNFFRYFMLIFVTWKNLKIHLKLV